MKVKKKSFILYDDDVSCVEHLSTQQAGQLLKAIVNLRATGEVPDFGSDAALKILFHQITTHIAINEERYQKICERNSQIARKRWDTKDTSAYESVPKDASAYESVPESTKRCLNDNDNDNVNDNKNDIDNDNVNDNVNEPHHIFDLNEEIKKPDFDMSSVENFFRSAERNAMKKLHQGSS